MNGHIPIDFPFADYVETMFFFHCALLNRSIFLRKRYFIELTLKVLLESF